MRLYLRHGKIKASVPSVLHIAMDAYRMVLKHECEYLFWCLELCYISYHVAGVSENIDNGVSSSAVNEY